MKTDENTITKYSHQHVRWHRVNYYCHNWCHRGGGVSNIDCGNITQVTMSWQHNDQENGSECYNELPCIMAKSSFSSDIAAWIKCVQQPFLERQCHTTCAQFKSQSPPLIWHPATGSRWSRVGAWQMKWRRLWLSVNKWAGSTTEQINSIWPFSGNMKKWFSLSVQVLEE